MATVQLDRLRKVYDNGYVAVAGATFEAVHGELLVLVGPSGCGKSTLLRIVSGLLKPHAGSVTWRGTAVTGTTEGVAMVVRRFTLFRLLPLQGNGDIGWWAVRCSHAGGAGAG